MDRITWRERWSELKRIYGGEKREVRYTAIGWQPSKNWIESQEPTASGNREFYIVARKGNGDENATATQTARQPVSFARPAKSAEQTPRPSPYPEVDPT